MIKMFVPIDVWLTDENVVQYIITQYLVSYPL